MFNLIAGRASGLERFGVMSAAVEFVGSPEVDEIDEKLLADATNETSRVPAHVGPGARRQDPHVPAHHLLLALKHTNTL